MSCPSPPAPGPIRDPAEPWSSDPFGPLFARPVRPKFQDRLWLHALLLLLTIATTTLMAGPTYSLTILLILGTHEMGHYLACRYYQVDASLPFFIPAPPPVLTGTFGAVIRIREPIRSKRMLFDIGAAGPFAGFAVALPALVLGTWLSTVQPIPEGYGGLSFGEPLLFKAVAWLIWGSIPDGSALFMHPVAFAAWFGLLATALNLFPFGQLDGGHIAYAVLGRRSTTITLGVLAGSIGLALFASPSWSVWALMLTGMAFMLGPRHPRTVDEDVPLDPTRRRLAALALLIFILCFTYQPIELIDIISGR